MFRNIKKMSNLPSLLVTAFVSMCSIGYAQITTTSNQNIPINSSLQSKSIDENFKFSPEEETLTPEQKNRLREYYKSPVVISRNIKTAQNIILNEPNTLIGMINPSLLPPEIAGSLYRAAIRIPVKFAVGKDDAQNTQNLFKGNQNKIQLFPQQNNTPITLIVSRKNTIIITQAGIEIWESEMQADLAKENLDIFLK